METTGKKKHVPPTCKRSTSGNTGTFDSFALKLDLPPIIIPITHYIAIIYRGVFSDIFSRYGPLRGSEVVSLNLVVLFNLMALYVRGDF